MGSILDRLFKSKTAKEIVKKFYSDDMNYQRQNTLERIKGAALNGRTNIVLDDPGIRLFDEDYDFFKKLGYTVYPEQMTRYCNVKDKLEYYDHKFGIISWE